MPTTYTDQFFLINPAAPPAAGTALSPVKYTITDQNSDGLIGVANNDLVNGSDITASYPGDTVRIRLADGTTVTYTGVTFYLANGQRVFTPTDGKVLQAGTFRSSSYTNRQASVPVGSLGPPCFTPGTLIATAGGDQAVEQLRPGMKVLTRDDGPQEVAWFAARHYGRQALERHANLHPILIPQGALGDGLPRRDLLVSPQHRMLVTSRVARRLFDEPEVLVAAKHLCGFGGISTVVPARGVTYLHFMCARHQVVMAEGAPTETMFAGRQALAALPADARHELLTIFPELASAGAPPPVAARRLLVGAEGRKVASIHRAKDRPLLQGPARA